MQCWGSAGLPPSSKGGSKGVSVARSLKKQFDSLTKKQRELQEVFGEGVELNLKCHYASVLTNTSC